MMERNPPPDPSLVARPIEGGEGWSVQIAWSDGRSEVVGVFFSQREAQEWIAHKSDAWLKDYVARNKTT